MKKETKLQFFKIQNKIIKEHTDAEIFSYLILNYNINISDDALHLVCALSQITLAQKHGNSQKFYSNAFNGLKDFITITKRYEKSGKKEKNTYTIKKVNSDFTMIYKTTIEKLQDNYKNLAYYCKLKRWVNQNTYIAKGITKQEIADACNVSKNTSNSYLKKLVNLKVIEIEENKKLLNCFNLTLTHELDIININKKIDEWNNMEV